MTALELAFRNWETFYRFDSGDRVNLIPRYFLIVLVSIFATVFSGDLITDFTNVSVSVLSIFAGFSFAVIFFIVEEKGREAPKKDDDDDLERELVIEKLEKLKNELFFNLSYFNMISIFAVCILLSHSVSIVGKIDAYAGREVAELYLLIFVNTGKFLAFFLVIEAIATFYRVVARLTFYFFEKFE